jgi:hypothetical protein
MTRLDPEEARQGKKGTPVLKVLIAALVLCAVVAIGLTFYAGSSPDSAVPATVGNEAGSSPAPAPTDGTTTPTPATPAPAN